MSKVSTYMAQYSLTYNHILYNHLLHLPLSMKTMSLSTCKLSAMPDTLLPPISDFLMHDRLVSQNYLCPRHTLVTKMTIMCLSTLSPHPLLFVIIFGRLFFIIIILFSDEMTNN